MGRDVRVRIALLVIAILSGVSGIVVLWVVDWRVLVGVMLLLWSDTIPRQMQKENQERFNNVVAETFAIIAGAPKP